MNVRIIPFLLLALSFATLSLTPAKGETVVPQTWQSTHFSKNPLVGRIFKGDGNESQSKVLALQAQLTRFVLLGEQHDNPDHHIIQANILQAKVQRRTTPSVVFEMVSQRLSGELRTFNLTTDPKLEDFAKRLEWEKRGWYSWEIYRPIALTAIKNSLPMFAGNFDVATTRKISKQGLGVLSDAQRRSYGLSEELSTEQNAELLAELQASHCGMMPTAALPAMANVQRARDGVMADALINSGVRFGAVLIAGNGHVRRDRAVPRVLRALQPGTKEVKMGKSSDGRDIIVRVPNAHTLSVGLIEVADGKVEFADYGLKNDQGKPLYDFVIFTPKFDVTDHCAAMREQFKKMKKKKAE